MMTDIERDAARWRKLESMLRFAEAGPGRMTRDNFMMEIGATHTRGNDRVAAVNLMFTTPYQDPVDLGAALDAVDWPHRDAQPPAASPDLETQNG